MLGLKIFHSFRRKKPAFFNTMYLLLLIFLLLQNDFLGPFIWPLSQLLLMLRFGEHFSCHSLISEIIWLQLPSGIQDDQCL